MTIPRGYIPGKTDFPVITSASGSISFDNDNLETSGSMTCNGLISPDIKALLDSHDYQYVYDWSALPANCNHKWTSLVHASATISVTDGILYMKSDAGEYINIYRENSQVKKSDCFVIEHRCKITSGNNALFNLIFSLTESEEVTSGSGTYRQYVVSAYNGKVYYKSGTSNHSLDIDNYHSYKLVKDRDNYFYFFIDDELIDVTAWSNVPVSTSSAYHADRNLLFGPYFGSTIYTGEMYSEYFKYSKISEGSKRINGTSSKIVGGNVDVKNQSETQGIQVTSTEVKSTGTNQNLELEANGTGEIVANSDFTGKAIEGVTQYKFNGASYTTAAVSLNLNEGYVILNNYLNNMVATLPSIGVGDVGKRIRIRNWNAGTYTTTVQRNDSDTIEAKDSNTSGTQLTFANVGDWVELAVDWSTIWKIVDKSAGVTLS